MTGGGADISGFGAAIRKARLGLGLGVGEFSADLGIQAEDLEAIERGDWSGLASESAYGLAVAVGGRLGLDLGAHSIDRAFFFGGMKDGSAHPKDRMREKTVLFVLAAGAALMLAWLLVPAKDMVQTPRMERAPKPAGEAIWQRPAADLPYPVLGEVFPEAPISRDGVLITIRATDVCNARIETGAGQARSQSLSMSRPWKLRVVGAFQLHLDNAGVVSVEVAGTKIPLGAGVGQAWSGSFDASGHRLQAPKPAPPAWLFQEKVEGMSD